MRTLRLLPLTLALSALYAAPAHAQSLLDLYNAAKGYDSAYQSARSLAEANQYKADQAKANLLPTVTASAGVSNTQLRTETTSTTDRSYDTQSASVSATQPLYRPANLASYRQGSLQSDLANAQLEAAEQDLIVRVSQAYFDVLASQDSLTFVQAQKVAVAEQLASAKRNFEVGTATITDTREAQARYDLVIAQEIAADNDLRVKKLFLDQLVGKTNATPQTLTPGFTPPAVVPDDLNTWVQQGVDTHPSVRLARVSLDTAKYETDKASSGHKPTLDLTGSYGYTRNINGSTISAADSRTTSTTVGVSLTVPLFAGFATQNRLRETLSLEEKARADLEAAQRSVAQATRTAYFGVVSGQGQVKALEAAETSSQSALDANKLGYQVGVRINIDVLNSQSQLFQTKRDLAKARYDLLMAGLKLRQANGTLKLDDLQQVNGLLTAPSEASAPATAAPASQSK